MGTGFKAELLKQPHPNQIWVFPPPWFWSTHMNNFKSAACITKSFNLKQLWLFHAKPPSDTNTWQIYLFRFIKYISFDKDQMKSGAYPLEANEDLILIWSHQSLDLDQIFRWSLFTQGCGPYKQWPSKETTQLLTLLSLMVNKFIS